MLACTIKGSIIVKTVTRGMNDSFLIRSGMQNRIRNNRGVTFSGMVNGYLNIPSSVHPETQSFHFKQN